MVIRVCPKCGKEFNRKDLFVYHTEKRKFPCVRGETLTLGKLQKELQATKAELKKMQLIQNELKRMIQSLVNREKYSIT